MDMCLHHMVILRSQNKITDFFYDFAWLCRYNPLTAKLFNLNFHLLEVVCRWRDPQLHVSENYSDLTK